MMTTAMGARIGLTELNPIFRIGGITGIIEINLLLFVVIGILYVAGYYGRKSGLILVDEVIVGVLLAFIFVSLYTVVWNNVRIIAGG